MASLSFAIGAKLWPVLLAPVLLWPFRKSPMRAAAAAAVLLLVTAALILPVVASTALGEDSGFVQYGETWEMNDALYMVFPAAAKYVLEKIGVEPSESALQRFGRAAALGIVCLVILWLLRNKSSLDEAPGAVLAVVAALFLVSPTQFPWYFAWMLPFLAIRPRGSLLLLTLMLPLYYLKFYYGARNNVDFFHYGVVWLEYLPVWLLLLWEFRAPLLRRRA